MLLLSVGERGLVDATSTLPQVWDFTHSATTGDIDGDGDIDIAVLNIGGARVTPLTNHTAYFLVNDGFGQFALRGQTGS